MLIIEGAQEGGVQGVRVLNHCVFCLSKLSNARDREKVEPGTALKYVRKITTVELVHGESTKKSVKDVVAVTEFPTADLNRVWREVVQRSKGAPITFPRTPPICVSCGIMLQKIYEALVDLDVFVKTFNTRMSTCGKDGSSAEEKYFTFVRQLKEAKVEDASRRVTLNFLEKLGHGGLKEEEYLHYFPKEAKVTGATILGPPETIQVLQNPGVKLITTAAHINEPPVTVNMNCSLGGQNTARKLTKGEFNQESDVEIKEEVPIPSELPSLATQDQDPLSDEPKWSRKRLRKLFCDICNADLILKKKVIHDHVRTHVGDYALSCPNPECPFVCAGLRRFKKHFQTYNTCAPYLPRNLSACSVCECKFSTQNALRIHMKTTHESGHKQFSCPVSACVRKFTNRQSVQLHISYEHVIKLEKARFLAPASFQKCPECGKNIHQDRIKPHLQTFHMVPPETQVPCKYCSYVFSNHDQLLDHFQVHTCNGIPVSCHMCPNDRKYLKVSGLRDHYFKEHQIGNKVVCEHCPLEFFTMQYLENHVKRIHSENPIRQKSKDKRFKCEDCKDDKLYTKNQLLSHRILQHGADPLSCQYCEETFSSKEALNMHENKHKGIVPSIPSKPKYICDLPGCGKVYCGLNNFIRHKMSLEHLGRTEAFICDECGKGFNTHNV